MNRTRSIGYINDDEEEELLKAEVELAIRSTPQENFLRFIRLQASLYAMAVINIYTHPKSTRIYYIEDAKQ